MEIEKECCLNGQNIESVKILDSLFYYNCKVCRKHLGDYNNKDPRFPDHPRHSEYLKGQEIKKSKEIQNE